MTQKWIENGFEAHALGEGCLFYTGRLPADLAWDDNTFEAAWVLHPETRPIIRMVGKDVAIPRWQQAYGRDYYFSRQNSSAAPVPPLFAPLLEWAKEVVDPRLNGLLLNWYAGPGHYIGPHNDEERALAEGAPIVTISFGETRIFRLTRKGPDGRTTARDIEATPGSVFVLPRETNRAWKHAVPKKARYRGRRISVTVRAFADFGPELEV
jgi:alkylated DNA repair dioxygenase AlkB